MKTKLITSVDKKEKIFSKFGINFIISNNQVFLIKKWKDLECRYLIENDAKFWLKLSKNWEKSEFSNNKNPLVLTENDWNVIKRNFRSVLIGVTNKCNSDCNICFLKESLNFDDITIDEIEEILSKIGKNKVVELFGGEPTTRSDFFEILKLIKKSGNTPSIFTNGIKLADLNFVKKMKEYGVYRVHISFDGFREEIYRKMRENEKLLYIKLKALKNLEKCGIQVIISSTIASGINDDEVGNLLKFCEKNVHFIKGISFYCATPYWGKFNINIDKILTPSDLLNILEEVSNGVVCKDYFIEWKKFNLNLYKIFKKFGINFAYGPYCPYSLFKTGSIKQFFSIKKLKKMNRQIKKNKVLFVLKSLFNKRFYSFVKLLLEKTRMESLGENVFYLTVGLINTPLTYIPYKHDSGLVIYNIMDDIREPPVRKRSTLAG